MKTSPLSSWLRLGAVCSLALFATLSLRAEEGAPKSEIPPSVLKRFDKNQDGKLDDAEKAKWEAEKAARREKEAAKKAEMLARFDTNKDGKLDEEERAAAKIAMAQDRTASDAAKAKEKAAKEAAKLEGAAAKPEVKADKEMEKAKEKAKEKGKDAEKSEEMKRLEKLKKEAEAADPMMAP